MTAKVTVCGLGPGGAAQITGQTLELLQSSEKVFLRTSRHPTATLAGQASSFDELYENASTFDEVYQQIAERLAGEAHRHGHVVYAVPGSPLVLERSVRFLRDRQDVDLEVLPAISFLDQVWASLQVDPVVDSVRLIDGLEFATAAAGQTGPLLVAHVHSQWVLSDIKLALDAGPEQRVIALQRLGTAEEQILDVRWPELDREIVADHLTSLYLPSVVEPIGYELARSVEVMARLRTECPWDRKQDHKSLRKYLIEEAYEVLEAIDNVTASITDDGHNSDVEPEPSSPTSVATPLINEGSSYQDLEEELGDLWFQILFHSQLASEQGHFTVADVAKGMSEKMIRRHPHVFDEGSNPIDGSTPENWDQLKQKEKQRPSALDGIPRELPALALSQKMLGRGAKHVQSPDLGHVGSRLNDAFSSELATDVGVGTILLALVELARSQGVDTELALRRAVAVASDRFRSAESAGSLDRSWVLG